MQFGVIRTGGSVDDQPEAARAAKAAGRDGVFTWTAQRIEAGPPQL